MTDPVKVGIVDVIVPKREGTGLMASNGTQVILSDGTQLRGVLAVRIDLRVDEPCVITLEVLGGVSTDIQGEATAIEVEPDGCQDVIEETDLTDNVRRYRVRGDGLQ